MNQDFYASPQEESVSGYIVEEKYCECDTLLNRTKYFFIISNPKTYKLKNLEVGKYTYNEYEEGDELE